MDIVTIIGLTALGGNLLYNKHRRGSDPLIDRLRYDLVRVDERAKDINYYSSSSSYTEDKVDMYLCLKDDKEQYYPYNMLIYVALHELAHAISKTTDTSHESKEFNDNFNMLLDKATKLGIFDPNIPLVTNYCGVTPDMK